MNSRAKRARSSASVSRGASRASSPIARTVVDLRPDLIALGYNQRWNEQEVEAECARRGVPAKVVRLGPMRHDELATRRIVERILERAHAAPEGGP